MTLQEKIEQEKLQIEENREKLAYAVTLDNQHLFDTCMQNIEEHEQLVEWLEELKSYRQYIDLTEIPEQYKLGFQDGIIVGNNNAIDDFAKRLTTYLGVENATKYGNKNAEQMRNSYETLMNYEIAESIDDVAEQLKAGE